VDVWRCCEGTEKTVEILLKILAIILVMQGAPLCFAVHCHCLFSSPWTHTHCFHTFSLSVVHVFIVFTRSSPQHKTYSRDKCSGAEISLHVPYIFPGLQAITISLPSLSFPTPDAVAPPGLQSGGTQTPTATPTDIMLLSPSSLRDSSFTAKQPIIPKDKDEENCCCVVF